MQVWDVNKEAPASMGGPFDIVLSGNAVHTCDDLAGELLTFQVPTLCSFL